MSSSSQNPQPVSSTRAFADLAAAIDRRVSSDRAAELLANFRTAILAEAAETQRKFVLSDEFVCDDWEAALQVADLIDPAADRKSGDES